MKRLLGHDTRSRTGKGLSAGVRVPPHERLTLMSWQYAQLTITEDSRPTGTDTTRTVIWQGPGQGLGENFTESEDMLAGSPSGLRVEPTADNARGRSASQALRLAVLMPGWTPRAWSPPRRSAGAAPGQVFAPRGHAR